jgi:periplasmic divalent cation tolerance protein
MGRIVEGPPMQDCKGSDILVVTTTVGSMDEARRFAEALVDRRLAACVQLDGIAASFYRWKGKLCEDPEVRVSIKTIPQLRAALEDAFEELHPYDMPQFLAAMQSAGAGYADWVRREVLAA